MLPFCRVSLSQLVRLIMCDDDDALELLVCVVKRKRCPPGPDPNGRPAPTLLCRNIIAGRATEGRENEARTVLACRKQGG